MNRYLPTRCQQCTLSPHPSPLPPLSPSPYHLDQKCLQILLNITCRGCKSTPVENHWFTWNNFFLSHMTTHILHYRVAIVCLQHLIINALSPSSISLVLRSQRLPTAVSILILFPSPLFHPLLICKINPQITKLHKSLFQALLSSEPS